jgi:hypothetical protein
VAFSYPDISEGVSFDADLVVFTTLAAFVMFPLFSYVLVHVYGAFTGGSPRRGERYLGRSLRLFLSVLLVFALASAKPIEGGFVVVGVLLFVHPLAKVLYKRRVSDDDFNSTLNKIYLLVLALANLIQIILKLAGLM